MNDTFPIAMVGELIGDSARAAILVTLLDARARTAGELAFTANVSAQSASGHLSKLVDGGLLTVRSVGRHRYYSLATAEVAHALEALGSIATTSRPAQFPRPVRDDLRAARSCYDHFAGRTAVDLADRLQSAGIIRPSGGREYQLGRTGRSWLSKLGIDLDDVRRSRRTFALQCTDWTERRPHVAGALGAALLARFFTLGWIVRRPDTRALRVTSKGAREFRIRLGLSI